MESKEFSRVGETVYTATLPNALSLRVCPRKDFARSFALLAVHYGGAMRRFSLSGRDIDTPAGVAHFLEHKMFDMPDGNALNQLSAAGASANAFTSSGMTGYYFESAQSFSENLRLLLRFVTTPYFSDESVQKEQGIIGQEVRMTEDNPAFTVYSDLMRCLYAQHPIRDNVVGTLESIGRITPQILQDCHKAFYVPANMALCVAGPVTAEEVLAVAMELLPGERQPLPQPDYGSGESPAPVSALHRRTMAVSAPQFILGSKVSPAEDGLPLLRQKLVAALSLRCLAGRSSPFYTELYAEGLLRNDFSCETDHSAHTATILMGGESRSPETVLERLVAAVERLSRSGFQDGSVERARRAEYGSRLRALDSFSSVCCDLAEGAFSGYLPQDAFELLWSITDEECADFLTRYLSPDALALSVIEPPKGQ
jgi:predicted Zn-dependent peptidase